jgi:HlyD family secretion protein
MEKASIFRAAAIERLSTPDRLDQPLRITTPLGWLALTALMALVVAG